MGRFKKISISISNENDEALKKILDASGGKYRGKSHLIDTIFEQYGLIDESNKLR